MAHVANFGRPEFGRMLAHWMREKDDSGEYITYRSENETGGHIHRERTVQNYTIGTTMTRAEIEQRLVGVYQKPGQKRPVLACDIVVTLPRSESLASENVKQFMQAVYESLVQQYGTRNNVIGAWVHMDEAQPHMHFAFLPISERNSKQKPQYKEKLSTREYFGKRGTADYQTLHRRLQTDVEAALGRKVNLVTGVTKNQGVNKTIQELKAETKLLDDHVRTYAGRLAEMDKLKGKHVSGLFSHEHIELSVQAYRRLRTLAKVGIERSAMFDAQREHVEQLEHENNSYKRDARAAYIRACERVDIDRKKDLTKLMSEIEVLKQRLKQQYEEQQRIVEQYEQQYKEQQQEQQRIIEQYKQQQRECKAWLALTSQEREEYRRQWKHRKHRNNWSR